MLCIACAARLEWPLCGPCGHTLRAGPQFLLDGRLLVAAAFRHCGAARRLVHRLKYDGLVPAGRILAATMALRLPSDTSALVPVPRALVRRVRHGIDPAATLADLIAARAGVPVVHCLRPAAWWPRHATRAPGHRRPARFMAIRRPPVGAVFVDDVVTSGATMAAAQRALGIVAAAVAATSPGLHLPFTVGAADAEKGAKASPRSSFHG